jgi:trans-aconitate 2-methyltransferase
MAGGATWDPAIYERYKSYRDRPALDLMLRIPRELDPREIWDLGCGTGEHAALLKRRRPKARVHGLDSSAEMLAEARGRPDEVDWVKADIAAFAPETPPDLIFTNAALHWLADHAGLFPKLVGMLAPGGVFACQMPMSFEASWHVAMRETAADGPWAERLAKVTGVQPLATAESYYDWLQPLASDLDIWSTVYLHALEGEDPVVDWMRGTGLRPFLQALEGPDEEARFLDAYRSRLERLFPRREDGITLLPFPRLFIVARRRPG